MSDEHVANMPEWKCHKMVRAAKIVRLGGFTSAQSGDVDILDVDGLQLTVQLEAEVMRRVLQGATSADLGYLVRYEDGYVSWSPSKAFEDGYTRL